MFTAMIIDDERIVREGIRELIDWEKAGFRLGSDGKDGRGGLANILRENPDLVLVDIKMPGLTGIEVIREARQQGFAGHFIILTSFSEDGTPSSICLPWLELTRESMRRQRWTVPAGSSRCGISPFRESSLRP